MSVMPPASARRRRVLVIEDNLDAGDSLRVVLELEGHEVTLARDGQSGYEAALRLRPDVVLCDIGLPGMDGYELARRLRREPALDRTTLVALSGYARPDDVEAAREAGFDRHLAKPPAVEVLSGLLSEKPRKRSSAPSRRKPAPAAAPRATTSRPPATLSAPELVVDLGAVTHDLRQPLAVLQIASDTVTRLSKPRPDSDLARSLSLIGVASRQMSDLVSMLDDALLLARDRLEPSVDRVSLQAIVQAAVVEGAASVLGRKIEVQASEDHIRALADRERLRRVVELLIDRAAARALAGRPVRVDIARVGGMVELSVRWDTASRVLREASEPEGPFWIRTARTVIAAMGGRLQLESSEGIAAARLTLPGA